MKKQSVTTTNRIQGNSKVNKEKAQKPKPALQNEQSLSLAKFPDENPNPVLRLTRGGEILYANPASADILKTWMRKVGQKVPKTWQGHISQVLESGWKLEVESDANKKHYYCTLVPLEDTEYINVYCLDVSERAQAEDEIKRSEEKFSLIFNNSPIGISISSLEDGRILDVNPAWCELMGYSRAEALGSTSPKLGMISAAERARLDEVLRTQGTLRNFETVIQHKSGEQRPVLSSLERIRLGDKPVMLGMSIDITKRKQAENALRASEQIARLMAHNLQMVNQISIKITSGLELERMLLALYEECQQIGDTDQFYVSLYDDATEMINFPFNYEGGKPSPIPSRRNHTVSGLTEYILEHRQTLYIPDTDALPIDGELSRNKISPSQTRSYVGVPLMIKDRVVGVLSMQSYKPNVYLPEQIQTLELLATQAAIAIQNAQLYQQAYQEINERKQIEGKLRDLNFQLEERIEERTRELHQKNMELERANRTKDEFLANMSHELRTPLNGILGMSEMLLEQRRDPLSPRQQKSLKVIESSGQHLLDLINDILDLSKIEAGKFDVYPQPVNVDELCRSSLVFVKTQAIKKFINIAYEEDKTVSSIYADPRRVKQILVNLLTNAVKFTPDHGQVTLQVHANAEQDLVQFTVADTGIGIKQDDLKRLFQPFTQIDSGLNRQQEGTGLGLALIQKLTDLHGGSVQVESQVGAGSSFTVNLPWGRHIMEGLEGIKISDAEAARIQDIKQSIKTRERRTILLAEDNLSNVLTVGEYLEDHGHEVLVAHDGQEAVYMAEKNDPDIILMDIQMPVMDGLEATRRLRANPRFATTPIIALTALAMPGDRERCLKAGANEYISKPVSLKGLMKSIGELLAQ